MYNFKVFSDFACPFCYIGFTIADKLNEERDDVAFEWLPYELDPTAPEDGSGSTNIPEAMLKVAFERIEMLGSEYGLNYNNKNKKFNTRKLHLAAMYAQSVEKFYPFAREAFKAVFEDGRNVALLETINDIGLKAELNIQEMNSAINEPAFTEEFMEAKNAATVYEIDSVPTFVREDNVKVFTLKDYENFKKDLLE
jgi:predicted DsbA family dithiol-disulfide isomerase